MNIIKWILAVLFALVALLQLAGGNIVGFLLCAIACGLVLPLLDLAIATSVAFLKSGPLRIFIAVVLAIVSLAIGGRDVASIAEVNVCTADPGTVCAADKPFFLAGEDSVTITAIANEGDAESIANMSVEVSYVATPGSDAEPVFNDVVVPDVDGDNLTVALSDIPLQVGSYNVTITPEAKEEAVAVGKKTLTFTVWPTQADVDQRLTTDISSTDFKEAISANFICVYDGNVPTEQEIDEDVAPGDLNYCDDTELLPLSENAFVVDYGFPDVTAADTEITYTLRYLPTEEEGGEPIELLTDTITIEEGLSRYGNVGELSEEAFIPGNYDLFSVINVPDAKPVRLQFSITE